MNRCHGEPSSLMKRPRTTGSALLGLGGYGGLVPTRFFFRAQVRTTSGLEALGTSAVGAEQRADDIGVVRIYEPRKRGELLSRDSGRPRPSFRRLRPAGVLGVVQTHEIGHRGQERFIARQLA